MATQTNIENLYHKLGLAKASGGYVSFRYINRHNRLVKARGYVHRLEGSALQWKATLTPKRTEPGETPSRAFTFFSERIED